MNNEKELFLNIINRLIWGSSDANDVLSKNEINWGSFKKLINYHELTPFVYATLKNFPKVIAADFFAFLKNSYYFALVHQQHLWREFLNILDVAEKLKIPLLPIKGIALLPDVYAKMPVRFMVDIDLLIKKEDMAKTTDMLSNLGYIKDLRGNSEEYWLTKQCHLAFCKQKAKRLFYVEVHFGLDFKRKGKSVLPGLWERIREIKVDGRKVKLLSCEDTLFSLALHNRRFGKTLCLKNAFDFCMILKKYQNIFNWDYVIDEAKRAAMCATIFYFLMQASIFFGLKIPNYVWKNLTVPTYKRKLICRFLEKNTLSPFLEKNMNGLYLKSHFLLYDSFWEPIEYILHIPQEQFAKFYRLPPHAENTNFYYKHRLWYMMLRKLFSKN